MLLRTSVAFLSLKNTCSRLSKNNYHALMEYRKNCLKDLMQLIHLIRNPILRTLVSIRNVLQHVIEYYKFKYVNKLKLGLSREVLTSKNQSGIFIISALSEIIIESASFLYIAKSIPGGVTS